MRVLAIGHDMTPVSGHARGIYELAPQLSREGIEVDFFTDSLDADGQKLLEALRRQHAYEYKVRETRTPGSLEALAGQEGFREALEKADLVHVFDARALFFARKQMTARRLRKKIVYSVPTFQKFDLKSFFSGPWVWTRLFDPHDRNFLTSFFFPKFLLPGVYSRADHILTSCQALKESIRQAGVPGEKISVIYPPVSASIFPATPERPAGKKFSIFYYGWFSDIRGVSELVNAFLEFSKKSPEAELVLSNPDAVLSPEARILTGRIREAGKQAAIRLLDFQVNIQECLEKADLVVLPFRGRFGYLHPPMALLEVIFKNRPFLTRAVASIGEIVHEPLLTLKDGESLAEKLRDAYRNYASYQAEARKCHERVTKLAGAVNIAGQYKKFYENILAEGGRYVARRYYSDPSIAASYDEERFTSAGGRLFDRLEKEILLAHVPADRKSSILEVGSGTGRFMAALGEEGYTRLAAADSSRALLKVLEAKLTKMNIPVGTFCGDIFKLPFKKDSFDCVYSIRVLNQLRSDADRLEAFQQLAGLVRPGGRLILDVVNRASLASMGRAGQQTDLGYFEKKIRESKGLKILKIIHRMSFSQTLMEKSPGFLAFLVYAVDRAFSNLLPFWGTRVYFVLEKERS